jgi:hypothetical protein
MSDRDHGGPYIFRHHPRDLLVIAILSFVCFVLLATSFSGVNIGNEIAALVGSRDVTRWLQLAGLIAGGLIYFFLVHQNRLFEADESVLMRDVSAARERAYATLARVTEQAERLEGGKARTRE